MDIISMILSWTYKILDRIGHIADEVWFCLRMEIYKVEFLGRVWAPHVHKLLVPGHESPGVGVPQDSIDLLLLVPLIGRPEPEAIVEPVVLL